MWSAIVKNVVGSKGSSSVCTAGKHRLLVVVSLLLLAMPTPSSAATRGAHRSSYGGGRHTGSHGGTYRGGQSSSHKGGKYRNPKGQPEYGTHQR
jgi:hypothetical protein